MTDFSIRSDAVDVEQIMRQIRARIREKRGIDYTEEEIQELATVRLERFLDPKGIRSDLIEQYRRQRPPAPANYPFEDTTIYTSTRGGAGKILTFIRKLLNPILRLQFNPQAIIHALHLQSKMNEHFMKREEVDALNYEVLHNLVVELTRLGIEVKNLKMRVESLTSRLDFDERRARALEGAVQYRPAAAPQKGAGSEQPSSSAQTSTGQPDAGSHRARRRRRRGRRRGAPMPPGATGAARPPDASEPVPSPPTGSDGDPSPGIPEQ